MDRVKLLALFACLFIGGSARALPPPSEVLPVIERLGNWQIDHLNDLSYLGAAASRSNDPRGWVQGVWWLGLTELANHSSNPRFAETVLRFGEQQQWRLGERLTHADDQLIGQTWLWAYGRNHDVGDLAPMRANFDKILADPPKVSLDFALTDPPTDNQPCQQRWCWSDALFMAPASWAGLSRLTGDARYVAYEDKEFWATVDKLYDRKEHLFFRDSRFFGKAGGMDGFKGTIYWSRGNGWVLAGLARTLEALPKDHPSRKRYERLYREFAARIVSLQKPDGTWPMSLLEKGPTPIETSGTALFTYGLAWGVRAGILDRKQTLPAIEKGWRALTAAIQPDGRIGWVQQIGRAPDKVAAEDTQFYGVGAMLLAGSAIIDLGQQKR